MTSNELYKTIRGSRDWLTNHPGGAYQPAEGADRQWWNQSLRSQNLCTKPSVPNAANRNRYMEWGMIGAIRNRQASCSHTILLTLWGYIQFIFNVTGKKGQRISFYGATQWASHGLSENGAHLGLVKSQCFDGCKWMISPAVLAHSISDCIQTATNSFGSTTKGKKISSRGIETIL